MTPLEAEGARGFRYAIFVRAELPKHRFALEGQHAIREWAIAG